MPRASKGGKAERRSFAVIGAGFSGLAAACSLAHAGHRVTVFEKNEAPGGRARVWREQGFTFDMGPSWYWMPDIFEDFFKTFKGAEATLPYQLVRLDPAFQIVFPGPDPMDVPGNFSDLVDAFDRIEPGAGRNLQKFMSDSARKYSIGVRSLSLKPCRSIFEFVDWQLISNLHRLTLFERFDHYVAKHFRDSRLRKLMEFPILFLGTLPHTTPALYSFMNYGGLVGGTWYPVGGMGKVVEAFYDLAGSLGVEFRFNSPVTSLPAQNGDRRTVQVGDERISTDGVIGAADYYHIESALLSAGERLYSEEYWQGRRMAPSSLIFFLGLNEKISGLRHHTLFFDSDFETHAAELYKKPAWPSDPLFYLCAPSVTDETVAPAGCENLFLLVPIAAGLPDSDENRELVFEKILRRLENYLGRSIRDNVVVKRSYCLRDFEGDYNAYKGNAYGLANTLRQTAFGKPAMVSKKARSLVYAGQLTVPGPGVPPSIISGQIAARELLKETVAR